MNNHLGKTCRLKFDTLRGLEGGGLKIFWEITFFLNIKNVFEA